MSVWFDPEAHLWPIGGLLMVLSMGGMKHGMTYEANGREVGQGLPMNLIKKFYEW